MTAAPKAGPWVEEDRSQGEPLPLVSKEDCRPAVKDLIRTHQKMIGDITKKLQDDPLYDPIKHDDLWILRYVLSHKKVDKSVAAAKKFLLYRKEKDLDAKDIRALAPGINCHIKGVRDFYDSLESPSVVAFSQPHPDRGVFLTFLLGQCDQSKLAKISDEDWPFWYFLEWMFQTLDSVTRRTGRLTQGLRIIDMKGYSIRQNNKECIDRAAFNARVSQDYYPQMLASVYVLNAPTWARVAFQIVKPLLPTRFVAKFAVVNIKSEKSSMVMLKHMSPESLAIVRSNAMAGATDADADAAPDNNDEPPFEGTLDDVDAADVDDDDDLVKMDDNRQDSTL
jgi:CRAL/TRIO domain